MIKFLKNKKAQTEFSLIFLYRFIIIVLIIGVVVGVVWYKFSSPMDVRLIEASVIANKIIDCLTNKLVLENSHFNQEYLKNCMAIDEDNIFINLSFKDDFFYVGRENLEFYCQAQEKIEGKYMPSCFNNKYSILDSENKLSELNIFIVLDKHEKNI